MGFAKIKGNLTSRIGCRVGFKAPGDTEKAGGPGAQGTIIDEIWEDPEVLTKPPRKGDPATDWGDYAFGAQLIKWDDGTHSIRLIYYRRRINEDWWEFASQMTVTADPPTMKRLCEKTLGKISWFSDPASTPDPK